MLNSMFTFVLVVSLWGVLLGQPLPSDRRARLETALLEQSILQNLRPLVLQLCSSESSTDNRYSSLRSEVQSLTNRIEALEEGVLQRKNRQKMDCITRFKKIDPAPDVHVFEGVCYYLNSSYHLWNDSQTACQLAGGQLVTLESKQVQDFLIDLISNSRVWVGARQTWSDGYNSDDDYSGDQPNIQTAGDCPVLILHDLSLHYINCLDQLPFVCEL